MSSSYVWFYKQCRDCSFRAYTEQAARQHACVTPPPSPEPQSGDVPLIGCSACQFTTTSEFELTEHRDSTGHGCFACGDECAYFVSTAEALRDHAHAAHSIKYPPPVFEQYRLYDASMPLNRRRRFYDSQKTRVNPIGKII